MPPLAEKACEYARAQRETHLEQLQALLRMPSISTLPEHSPDIQRTAQWLADELRRLGMKNVEIFPTDGHPVVYGEWLGAQGSPTVLIYGHYDVQPADPWDEWDSPPFEPVIRGEDIHARGASDMKGQIAAILRAVDALRAQGDLPVNVKFLLEGEEEVGSPHLGAFIDAHSDMLSCDVVLNCDSGIQAPDTPAITYALRGLAYFEVEVQGPEKDLHSGLFGGAVHNPAQALCELIAGMHDAEGRITLPGFYDRVRELEPDERESMAKLPHSGAEWLEMSGAPALWGESGYTVLERIGARPTLDVNGLVSGFTGTGSKTVLPAKALAKISMRLVPDQDSSEVYGQLCEYMRRNAPESITWEVREMTHAPAAIMDRRAPAMQVARKALEDVFGVPPIFRREGGTIPVVHLLQTKLGVDTVMLGCAMPGDGIHGPNEKHHLPNFFRGIETYIRFLCGLAEQ